MTDHLRVEVLRHEWKSMKGEAKNGINTDLDLACIKQESTTGQLRECYGAVIEGEQTSAIPGCTATAVSPSIVSRRVVATTISSVSLSFTYV